MMFWHLGPYWSRGNFSPSSKANQFLEIVNIHLSAHTPPWLLSLSGSYTPNHGQVPGNSGQPLQSQNPPKLFKLANPKPLCTDFHVQDPATKTFVVFPARPTTKACSFYSHALRLMTNPGKPESEMVLLMTSELSQLAGYPEQPSTCMPSTHPCSSPWSAGGFRPLGA